MDNIIESTDYPRSMFHIFLGVYPNDPDTIAVAEDLARRHENVHVIINNLPGPTSKAQNINHVIREIRAYEKKRHWQFASLTIHDSEDVVHPLELRVTNYLLEQHDVLQFPVFPLMEMPRFGNYFRTMTTGTYADEFSENHFSTMVSRYMAGAFVPSAGTGFALSRKALASFGEADVLPSNSLTEDYRLSLTLYEKGMQVYYVLESVPRINDRGKLVWDYVTTRSKFPKTFKTAVRQKTRWIYGITMQSVRFREIFSIKGLHLAGRYSLYRDMKAKVGNLLSMVGYPVLIYFLISLFLPLQPIYPKGSLSWYLSFAVTVMMIQRQLFRSVSIYHVYGMRSVFFACLLPPLFPLRLIWGNIINMVATVHAYRQKITARQTRAKLRTYQKTHRLKAQAQVVVAAPVNTVALNIGSCQTAAPPLPVQQALAGSGGSANSTTTAAKPVAWAKTDHEFLSKPVLRRYQRTLGDTLLEWGFISADNLAYNIKEAQKKNEKLGHYLRRQNLIDEQVLLLALAHVKHIPYVRPYSLSHYNLESLAGLFDEQLLRELLVLPLLHYKQVCMIAVCDDSAEQAKTELEATSGQVIKLAFTTRQAILNGLDRIFGGQNRRSAAEQDLEPLPAGDGQSDLAERLVASGRISCEQAVWFINYIGFEGMSQDQVLEKMGFVISPADSDAATG